MLYYTVLIRWEMMAAAGEREGEGKGGDRWGGKDGEGGGGKKRGEKGRGEGL